MIGQCLLRFTSYGAFDKDSIKGNFKNFEYEPKKWDETDVDIKILYCGVCASDIHTASSGWGETDYPQVVGHELVGYAVRVGSEVKHVKVGDLVGVRAQNDSCGECGQCTAHREPYCDNGQVGTYAGVYKKGNGKGDKSYGGYANYHRAPGHFVLQIPKGLDPVSIYPRPALAAPMLCGGVTVYSPLTQYGAGTTAKDVGIVGIGGLDFGLLFANALGANVTAISHSASKKADAEKMGASRFIESGDGSDKNFAPYKRSLDLIVATTNDDKMPILGYLSLLRPGGNLILVGAPEKPLPPLPAFPLILSNVHIGGSAIGSPNKIAEMLELAATQKIHPWIVKRPLDSVNETIPEMVNKGARYRFVLVNEENGGKLD
ncbi:BQ5605_C003g02289 [Microbotryum silenes-dioicae]|uniref:BQ5605_C003g02289 protein n=1 Tax=Microbotryum silenes-dioicae TaxID=796604 RepID=A0A2X0MVT1_9BASI|nr:BQ5605_C003g02289 [Microbotryum silenes-dioicae]